ncbi:MAG: insulinase family protein, partial [Prevotella sp.]|nr:insulinase family protein [Prevotella sp.]
GANAADAAAESLAAVSLPPQQHALCDEWAGGGGGKDTAAAVLPPYVAQHIEHHMDTHLAHVMLGTRAYDVHDERRIALYLLNNILGGPGMTARLNVSLRERNALVYTVESMAQSYSDTGLWAVYFGCDPKNVKRCLRLIRRELDKVMQRPLSDAQLRAAKRQIRGQIGIACDSRESFALDFAKSYLHYGWRKDVTALCERIDALTAADLQRVAQDLFAEERLTTLVIK